MVSTMLMDLQFGVRMLVKRPLLALIAVVSIGLGVGITTHSFSTVYGSMLRGVPIPGNDRLAFMDANHPELAIEWRAPVRSATIAVSYCGHHIAR